MERGIILPTDFIFGKNTIDSGITKIISSVLIGLFLYVVLTFGLIVLWIIFGGIVLFLFFDGLKDIIIGAFNRVKKN